MSRDLDERLRDHFATRDQKLTVTPFDEIFVEEDFAKDFTPQEKTAHRQITTRFSVADLGIV